MNGEDEINLTKQNCLDLVELIKGKYNKPVKIILIIIFFFLISFAVFYLGAYISCKSSEGTLLNNLHCINYSSLDYCHYKDRVYKPDPRIPMYDFNISENGG